jgi:pimeloyl-ACP methyl ester carboxylesterase/predicted glycosyltransferase
VERDGVRVHYEIYGAGTPTLVLIPPGPITHSRSWKCQIPYLSRHFRVVTLDGRGNGRSDRVEGSASHTLAENVADVLAVMDAADVPKAILVAHCHANGWAIEIAARHPERVTALVAIDPGVPYLGGANPNWVTASATFDQLLDDPRGWQLYNRHVIVHDYRRWLEFFFGEQLVEPHSTKLFEDMVGWALETTGNILVAAEVGQESDPPTREEFERSCHTLSIPVLVIHGNRDPCQRVERGRELAERTKAELLVVEGCGHLPHGREPVRVNLTIQSFVDRVAGDATSRASLDSPEGGVMPTRTWTRARNRPKRALYVSSPIGLGHARRDVAIAHELRALHPDLEIHWLAQDPVTLVLQAEGETIHPASRWLASESAHIVSETTEHHLHCFQALRNMDEILLANFMIFQEVVDEGLYDLVIGDEAWEVDHFWHENPELKRGAHAWLTDFVGYLPMPAGGAHEAYLTADYNAEMIEHVERFPRIRDRAIFVGNPDDVIPEAFGPGLPMIRDWTRSHFEFSGYITGFAPPNPQQALEWREELGYSTEEKVCVVAVGGSGVGRALLEKVIAAYPRAKRELPELRMVAIAGPRIDPTSLPRHSGLEIRGYVDRLYRHLSVCDLAVVQGGLTTTMELAAAGRPFLYFPLRNHFEQNFHVRHRLDRYGAGICLQYDATHPDQLADTIVSTIARRTSYRSVETDGAKRAAASIAELL